MKFLFLSLMLSFSSMVSAENTTLKVTQDPCAKYFEWTKEAEANGELYIADSFCRTNSEAAAQKRMDYMNKALNKAHLIYEGTKNEKEILEKLKKYVDSPIVQDTIIGQLRLRKRYQTNDLGQALYERIEVSKQQVRELLAGRLLLVLNVEEYGCTQNKACREGFWWKIDEDELGLYDSGGSSAEFGDFHMSLNSDGDFRMFTKNGAKDFFNRYVEDLNAALNKLEEYKN